MKCDSCGNDLSPGANFCKYCGASVENNQEFEVEECSAQINISDYSQENDSETNGLDYEDEHTVNPGKSNKLLIVILISVIALLITVIIVGIIVVAGKNNKKPAEDPIVVTQPVEDEEIAVDDDEDVAEEAEEVYSFNRIRTYNQSYTYKNIPDIHYSVEADDEEALKMQSFINDYNYRWINYVNYGNNALYEFLRKGTHGYNNAVGFDTDGVTESLEIMEVNDVRKFGSTYYVWTHEIITKYTVESTERKEYHWVYRVRKDGMGYYVDAYTADPYYE